MKMLNGWSLTMAMLFLPVGLVGCSDSHDVAHDDHDEHVDHDDHAEHGETGPHGGHLIELGHDHQFHAELVDDDARQQVVVYLLDGDMKDLGSPLSAASLVMTADGQSATFELLSGPYANMLTSNDAGLLEMLDSGDDVSAKLRVTIDGTPFSGMMEHHDHEGHDEEDHHDDDHDH